MPAVAAILRTIAVLFVVLMAPKQMMMRHVRHLDLDGLLNLVVNLKWMRKRGRKLRYRGESLDTVAARIRLIVWIAHDPVKALRYLAVRTRGWKRARQANVAPPAWGAVKLWLAPAPTPDAEVAFADSS